MAPQDQESAKIELEFGRFLSHPPSGEEIVISGLSGVYPNSSDVAEFSKNLYEKIDMVDDDHRRWPPFMQEVPQRAGKLWELGKLDAGFFGMLYNQVQSSEPSGRIFLEKTVEALFDAGINPSEIEGTKTGVYVGTCTTDSEKKLLQTDYPNSLPIIGSMKSAIINRISNFLRIDGVSLNIDTACSSSLFALENAFRDLRMGKCDTAIVAGLQLCLHPLVTLQFARLGVLGIDGKCKCFDESENGYVRSEAIITLILQKQKNARRSYCTLVHAKTNDDGYKDQGITFPSRNMQTKLLQEFYAECGIDPTTLAYVEAHGTGTPVGDPEECAAIDKIFAGNRKSPLLIGSVKSNIGHTEASSGLCSVTKCIIAFENNLIPPNIHFKNPRKDIKGLMEGRLSVVTEPTPFKSDNGLIAINCFGFGGANCHTLLKQNPKEKKPTSDDIPRLVCVSARTREGIDKLLDSVVENRFDKEHIGLLHKIFKGVVRNHVYRGYLVCSETDELERSITSLSQQQHSLGLVFANIEDQWKKVGKDLLVLPKFAETISTINEILRSQNLSIYDYPETRQDLIQQTVLGSIAVQLGVAEVLKNLDLDAKHVIGEGINQLAALYYQDKVSLEESIAVAASVAEVLGKTKESCVNYLVEINSQKVENLCNNFNLTVAEVGNASVISGYKKDVEPCVKILKQNNVQCEKLGNQLLNFDSPLFVQSKPALIQKLSTKITTTKTASVVENFITDLSNVQFFKKLRNIDEESTLLEAGNGFSRKVLQDNNVDISVVEAGFTENDNNLNEFLSSVGKLYERGYQPTLENLYPKIEFPVSRGTPMISPYICWNHDESWFVPNFANPYADMTTIKRFTIHSTGYENWEFVQGHVIDGRTIFPAAGYLKLAWLTLSQLEGKTLEERPVTFENCRFIRSCIVPKQEKVEFTVRLQRGSGMFEITENEQTVVTGKISDAPEEKECGHFVEGDNDILLKTKDVYKELRLRGYNYSGDFRAITECNTSATQGKIRWTGEWVTFIDNMLQMKILGLDTRLLFVPISIEKMIIHPKAHLEACKGLGESPEIPVYSFIESNIVQSGGIDIRGLIASIIPRKKVLAEPVLEKHTFVPNESNLSLENAIRVNTQILYENTLLLKVKGIEVVDEASKNGAQLLSPLICSALEDMPLIQPTLTVFSKSTFEDLPSHIKVEDKLIESESDCAVVVGSKILSRPEVRDKCFKVLKDGGFIISREDLNAEIVDEAIDVITVYRTDSETLVLFKEKSKKVQKTYIDISSKNEVEQWLPKLQRTIQNQKNLTVYAQEDPDNGILGFVNCLRQEPGNQQVKGVFIQDTKAPIFDPQSPFYSKQLEKNIAVNVYKDGQWGTYRHLLLDNVEVENPHIFCSVETPGDLSSLHWREGHITNMDDSNIVQVYYGGVNFKDVMLASGKLQLRLDRLLQDDPYGLEFAGRDQEGRRVFCMGQTRSMTTVAQSFPVFTFQIPDHWTMEEAATVPCVYLTVLYSLFEKGNLKRGESILIHSGSGGVGQAAIYIAQYYGCKIFTTVGTAEKREFLKKKFPGLTDDVILSSRDASFESNIRKATGGKGVDLVLNSLSDELLFASVRCLARGGRFLEIGKYNLTLNTPIGIHMFENEQSYHGIGADTLSNEANWRARELLIEHIKNGAIQPLDRTVFTTDELEKAFRFMTTGKHMGKVLIKFRDEEDALVLKVKPEPRTCVPKFHCDPNKVQVILGGLGGFGLELADWLVVRGAKNLLLTSRTGVKTGYQALRIKTWKSYGVNVKISTANITTKKGCSDLIREAQSIAPIESIFNLAVVLRDALLENQTANDFRLSLEPKATATKYLDELTRQFCPDLRNFVVFSSVSCGRGNAGQTNYGMSNSVMERICEKRHKDGFAATAIQWGAIGEVGLVADMQEEHVEIQIGGTLQQRIANCMKCMDLLLRQSSPIVSSMVVAEKKVGSSGNGDIVATVATILGLKDLKSISMHATLAEIGMDSMTGVEVKQTLEREFDIFLTTQDMRNITFTKLQEIQAKRDLPSEEDSVEDIVGVNALFSLIGDEKLLEQPVVKLESRSPQSERDVILYPGGEGVSTSFIELAKNLSFNILSVQYCFKYNQNSVVELARDVLQDLKPYLSKDRPFSILGYSFGSLLALETVKILEQEGYKGQLLILDGGPHLTKELTKAFNVEDDNLLETMIITHVYSIYYTKEQVDQIMPKLLACKTLEDKINLSVEELKGRIEFSFDHLYRNTKALLSRVRAVQNYQPTQYNYQSEVTLVKPLNTVNSLPEDYHLGQLTGRNVEVFTVEGNHNSIVNSLEVAEVINKVFGVE